MTFNLENKLDIHELLGRAALGYDERDTEMLVDCFIEEAQMTMCIAGGDLIGPFIGRGDIMTLMTDSMASQTDVRRHVVSNIIFLNTSEQSASVISSLTLLATENGVTNLLSAGLYRDEVVNAEGGWKIAKRHLDLDTSY
ncbi:MAG: nuclear transport factor 2 family protein [Pseudomonadales bacterium]|nr:nuclear transport factor 2 family protein [Pseudomonadales bacterium]